VGLGFALIAEWWMDTVIIEDGVKDVIEFLVERTLFAQGCSGSVLKAVDLSIVKVVQGTG
jgi:hypothetical protein